MSLAFILGKKLSAQDMKTEHRKGHFLNLVPDIYFFLDQYLVVSPVFGETLVLLLSPACCSDLPFVSAGTRLSSSPGEPHLVLGRTMQPKSSGAAPLCDPCLSGLHPSSESPRH